MNKVENVCQSFETYKSSTEYIDSNLNKVLEEIRVNLTTTGRSKVWVYVALVKGCDVATGLCTNAVNTISILCGLLLTITSSIIVNPSTV